MKERASTSRMKSKKRKEEDDDNDSLFSHHDSVEGEDIDLIQDEASSSRIADKKQERKTADHHHAESSSKRKEPTPRKTVQPHKARKLNDALKDFQNNFGISSSPSSFSKTSGPTSKATSKSTPLSKQNGFKSSFADPPINTRNATPTRPAASTRNAGKPISSLHQFNTETPVKSAYSKNASSILAAPLKDHKSPDEERDESISRIDKSKGRAVDTSAAVLNDEEEVEGDQQASEAVAQTEAAHADAATHTNRKHGGVTSLLELSSKKQFKMPSTPSKPSPLSGRIVRGHMEGTPSGEDVKPLKSLGAISGLSSLSSIRPEGPDTSHTTGGTTKEDIKPKWAQLLENTESSTRSPAQDITELLSPRKKRKGWVPAGNAEAASLIIKRLQTGNNLWIHEISRTLTSLMSSSSAKLSTSTSAATTTPKVKKEYANPYGLSNDRNKSDTVQGIKKIEYKTLARDLNPHLKLEILQILSPKAASLTWSSSAPDERGAGGGGGFITAGAAEKLLITRCRILSEDENEDDLTGGSQKAASQQPFGRTLAEFDSQAAEESESSFNDMMVNNQASEGLVIFSLTAHSRTSTGVSMVRKEQQRPQRDGHNASENEQDGGKEATSMHRDTAQPQLNFSNTKQSKEEDRSVKRWSVFIPASIADLHTQLRVNDEIWIWEPWSVVDLVGPEESRSALDVLTRKPGDDGLADAGDAGMRKASEKALLVSRFAVLL